MRAATPAHGPIEPLREGIYNPGMAARLALLLLLAALALPQPVRAEGPEWQELRTEYLAILYAPGHAADARRYAQLAEATYQELAQILGVGTRRRVTVRLYPTWEAYVQAHPFVGDMPGLLSHAHTPSRQISIALSRVRTLGPRGEENNLRHEMAHILLAQASQDRLPAGLHEAVAQYLELPEASQSLELAPLEAAYRGGRLLSWAQLNETTVIYQLPQLAYPQALSVAAFLADRYGMERLVELVHTFAHFPGYRSAMEEVYGRPAFDLEEEWRAYLPHYLAGRWRHHVLYRYDLSTAELALARGAYTQAHERLSQAVEDLQRGGRAEDLERARRMLAEAETGLQGERLAVQGVEALQQGRYPRAAALLERAAQAFAELGRAERQAEVEALLASARQGQEAEGVVTAAKAPSAALLRQKVAILRALGNEELAGRGQERLAQLESVERRGTFAAAVAGLSLILLRLSGVAREAVRPEAALNLGGRWR